MSGTLFDNLPKWPVIVDELILIIISHSKNSLYALCSTIKNVIVIMYSQQCQFRYKHFVGQLGGRVITVLIHSTASTLVTHFNAEVLSRIPDGQLLRGWAIIQYSPLRRRSILYRNSITNGDSVKRK